MSSDMTDETQLRAMIAEEVKKALAEFKVDLEEDRRKREEADLFSVRNTLHAQLGRQEHE